jgi:hypothetical protein
MAFPVSPVDGQTATVNNIVYVYSSSSNTWTRTSTGFVNLGASGNISAIGNIYGNNIIGNIVGNINANTAVTVTGNAQPNITSVGTLTSITSSGLISTTGNISGNYILGNASLLTAVNANTINTTFIGTANTYYVDFVALDGGNAQTVYNSPFLTYIPTSGILGVSALTATGNVNGANILSGGLLTATGNISGGNILTAGLISATSTITSAANIAGGNILTAGLISATGTVTGSSLLGTTVSASGNVVGANIFTSGILSAVGNAYIGAGQVSANATTGALVVNGGVGINGNLFTTGTSANIVAGATGNVTINIGTGVPTANTATINIGTSGGSNNYSISNINLGSGSGGGVNIGCNFITNSGYSQISNNTGTVTLGLAAAATVSGATKTIQIGTNGLANSIANIQIGTGAAANSNVIIAIGPIAGIGNVYFNSGTPVTIANTLTIISTTTSGNLLSSGIVSATGNIVGANILTAGLISATGNITGNYILGNGALLTGVSTSSSNINNGNSNVTISAAAANITVSVSGIGNVVVFAPTGEYVTGLISASGSITGGNLLTGGLISATGNLLTNANLSVSGNATIVGSLNVQGNVTFIGSNVITTNDLYIELANNQTTLANVNNAGLAVGPIGGVLTYWQYQNSSNAWSTNVGISATANITSGNLVTAGLVTATGNITGGNILTAGLMSSTGNITGGNILTAGLISATANITSAANIIQTGTGNINGYNGYFSNNLTVIGTFQSTSNITANGAGIFYGNTVTGNNALFAGVPGFTPLGSNVVVQIAGNVNSYSQINFQNINAGNASTTEIIVTANNGNDVAYFGDFGIAGNTYANASPFNSLGTSVSPNDTYVYAQGNANGGGGNLIIGSNEKNGVVRIIANGSNIANVVATFANGSVSVTGAVSASGNITGGNLLTAGIVSATGNINAGNASGMTYANATGIRAWTYYNSATSSIDTVFL